MSQIRRAYEILQTQAAPHSATWARNVLSAAVEHLEQDERWMDSIEDKLKSEPPKAPVARAAKDGKEGTSMSKKTISFIDNGKVVVFLLDGHYHILPSRPSMTVSVDAVEIKIYHDLHEAEFFGSIEDILLYLGKAGK